MADVLTTAEPIQTEVPAATKPVSTPDGVKQPLQSEQKDQVAPAKTPDAKAEKPKADPPAKAEDAAEPETTEPVKKAPEKYEFVQPEGGEVSKDVLGAWSEIARELDLDQEAAQKVLDKVAPAIQQAQNTKFEATAEAWATESRANKEWGGDKLEATLLQANKALDKFGSPALRTLLHESRLGNHPEVISFLRRINTQVSEDSFVAGDASPSKLQGPKDFAGLAETLYGSKT